MISPEKFSLEENQDLSGEHISKWWDSFKHPLIVKSSLLAQEEEQSRRFNVGTFQETLHPNGPNGGRAGKREGMYAGGEKSSAVEYVDGSSSPDKGYLARDGKSTLLHNRFEDADDHIIKQ